MDIMTNNLDKQYLELLQHILDNGNIKVDRTGTGTKSVFDYTIRFNMKEGFPLLTSKKMFAKGVIHEMIWFLRGDTNIYYLVNNDVHIWDGDAYKNYKKKIHEQQEKDGVQGYEHLTKESFIERIKNDDEFAVKWGDLGPIYGKQWRFWSHMSEKEKKSQAIGMEGCANDYIDQIEVLINNLKTDPDSRRLLISAWNVADLDSMVLPPCHYGFQCYTRELSHRERCDLFGHNDDINRTGSYSDWLDTNGYPKRVLDLMWNQRSVDTFLGLPFNIASYGLLLLILAKEVNMVPGDLIGNLGDTHLYRDHIEPAKEQIENFGKELTWKERADIYLSSAKPGEGLSGCSYESDKQMHEWYDRLNIPRRTREPFELPTMKINDVSKLNESDCLPTYSPSDFILENYKSHPTIKAHLSN